ncbi:MAG TPA: peptidoglycan DD-metalloendopeptidase family protein [Acidimicrobiales bacterium]|nr:peptidoglycan DD-metalloendopeptidase family protein [Acidimicrobiales bacterium]
MGAKGWVAAAVVAALAAGVLVMPLAVAVAGGSRAAAAPVAGIPPRVLAAYRAVDGWCPGLRWQLVAGVGAVESGHGTSGGAVADPANGEVAPEILGIPLDGRAGTRALPIGTWLGWFGLSGPWQQAVGPMQFLPGTFSAWAVDADGDGVADPNDIDDAAATAANYLCGGRAGAVVDEAAALRRYNDSADYVARVLAAAHAIAGASGPMLCPVAGPTTFTDTWGAPRSGGRRHQGVDMFAAEGTPVVAPVAGVVELRADSLGGLAFHLWGDDGTYYYGAHLSAYEGTPGHVEAGTVVGYVGNTGDATGGPAHLHFEIHHGRRRGDPPAPVDPTPAAAAACRSHPTTPGGPTPAAASTTEVP